MRVAICYADRESGKKWEWIHAALQRVLGHDVPRVRSISDLRDADRKCDVVLFEQRSACLNDVDLIATAAGHKACWVQWWFDLIVYDPAHAFLAQPVIRDWRPVMGVMDRVLVKERSYLNTFWMAGIPAFWFQQACPREMSSIARRTVPEFDAMFIGSSNHERHFWRRDVARRLAAAGMRVGWIGCGSDFPKEAEPLPPCAPMDLPTVLSNTVLVVDVPLVSHRGYWSDRAYLAGGCGVPVASLGPAPPWCLHCEEELDVFDLVQKFRTDPPRREATGTWARDWIMAHDTYDVRVRQLLECVRQEPAMEHAGGLLS